MAASFSPRAQRWLKALHVLLAAIMTGGIAAALALVLLRKSVPVSRDPFPYDLAVYVLFTDVVSWAFYALLLTGLAYSLFTGWGFLRYRWVSVKWLGFAALFAAAWMGLGPAVHGLVALSDAGLPDAAARNAHAAHGARAGGWLGVFLAGLAGMVAVSVLKPWGLWRLQRTLPRPLVLGLAALLVAGLGGTALLQAVTLAQFRALPVPASRLAEVPDGTHPGQATFAGFTYAVDVAVRDQRMVGLQVRANRDSDFARLAEGILPRMLAAQDVRVDAITGATTTSRALQLAVADALARAARSK